MTDEVNGVIIKELREVGETSTSINQMIQNVEKSEKVKDFEVEMVSEPHSTYELTDITIWNNL